MDQQTANAYINASNSVNNAASIISSANLNYKTRQWNEKIMQTQRDWALADRDYANQYNSPEAVMARAKDAGINPMYAATNGQVITASQPVRNVESASWHPQNPIPYNDNPNSVLQNMNLALMQAQLENVKSQNANINADTELKLKNAQNTGLRSESQAMKNQVYDILRSNTIGQELLKTANLKEDLDVKEHYEDVLFTRTNLQSYQLQYLHSENARRELASTRDWQVAMERIALMQKQELLTQYNTDLSKEQRIRVEADQRRIEAFINNLQKDGQLKQLLIDFNGAKLDPSSEIGLKIADMLMGKAFYK